MPPLDNAWQEWLSQQLICSRCSILVEPPNQLRRILIKVIHEQVVQRDVCQECAKGAPQYRVTETDVLPGVTALQLRYEAAISVAPSPISTTRIRRHFMW